MDNSPEAKQRRRLAIIRVATPKLPSKGVTEAMRYQQRRRLIDGPPHLRAAAAESVGRSAATYKAGLERAARPVVDALYALAAQGDFGDCRDSGVVFIYQ